MTGTRRIACTMTLALAALAAATLASGKPVPGAPACPMTPADSFWHADVSSLPVHPQSATWVAAIGASAGLKADFGSGTWNGGPIGIPFTTVPGNQPRVPVSFEYDDESDAGPYPIPPTAPIEGGASSSGDRHVLVVDRDACRLWELYAAYPQNGGASWTAGSGATWDLNANTMRPLGWTSGDAAGLLILPGLVRRDEVDAGVVDHVIRFTAPRTANAYVWPASHKAGTGGASDPPMGAWFRLKASFDIGSFSAANQVILRALKKHGMVLADNGSPFYLSGVPDPAWNNSDLNLLKNVPGSAFEAVDVSSLRVSNTSYAVSTAPPPPPPTPPVELVANTGFETNLAGWAAGNKSSTVKRTCSVARTGSCSVELKRGPTLGDAVLDDVPNTVSSTTAGATYAASAWVRAIAGRTLTLRLVERNGNAVVRTKAVTATSTGNWQQLAVTTDPASGGTSLGIEIVVTFSGRWSSHVDDVSLTRA